jgi:hypothetical protein
MKDFPFILAPMKYFFIFHTIGSTDLLHPSPAPHFKTFQMFLFSVPGVQVSAPSRAVLQMYYLSFFFFFSKFKSNLLAFLSTHSFARSTLLPLRSGLQFLQNISTCLTSYASPNASNSTLNTWSNSITRRSVRSINGVMLDNDMDFVLL